MLEWGEHLVYRAAAFPQWWPCFSGGLDSRSPPQFEPSPGTRDGQSSLDRNHHKNLTETDFRVEYFFYQQSTRKGLTSLPASCNLRLVSVTWTCQTEPFAFLFLKSRIIGYKTYWYKKTMLLFQQREAVGKKYTRNRERLYVFLETLNLNKFVNKISSKQTANAISLVRPQQHPPPLHAGLVWTT